jgi:hypothetical protein
MTQTPIHYELFIRRKPGAPWTLAMATEDRTVALSTAEQLMEEKRAVAVKVTKETLNEESRSFRSSTILAKGQLEVKAKKTKIVEQAALCVSPSDLYSMHSRDRIGRLFEEWLNRIGICPFEHLHRPDLAEQLESAGMDMQGAIQKISIPEAQSRGLSVHEVMRSFQALSERTFERLRNDHKKGVFPDPTTEGFAEATKRLSGLPDPAYLLGGGVAAYLAPVKNWGQKIGRLLDLADKITLAGEQLSEAQRALALRVIEQPLAEILGSKRGLSDLFGDYLNLGQRLAAMTRLTAPKAVDDLIRMEPALAPLLEPLDGPAARLAKWLAQEAFVGVRASIGRQIISDLRGPRRLCPDKAHQEVDMLRALAMALTFASGKLLTAADVQEAFVERSRMLLSNDFVADYTGECGTALEEAEALIRLLENAIGKANKRQAAVLIRSHVGALKFEREVIGDMQPARAKLQLMAKMQRSIVRAGLPSEDADPIIKRIGEVGGFVEADGKYLSTILKTPVTPANRLLMVMALASGETGPLGAVADLAKTEVMKLLRQPDVRKDISASPEAAAAVKKFIDATATLQVPARA